MSAHGFIPTVVKRIHEASQAARSAAHHAIHTVIVDDTEVQRRQAICVGCEHFTQTPVSRCLKCGCPLALKGKLKSGACPVGKW